MSELQPSAALLRSRLLSQPYSDRARFYESGKGTKPATQAYQRQAAALAAEKVLKQTRRRRPTTEERLKEIGRRRTWAGGGNLPPNIRASYSEAERAALAVIADQCRRKGFCDLCIDEIARLAGVGRTSVQNAIRKARSNERSHLSVRERPQQSGKSLTNIIKIICGSWLGWIGRAIGFKRLNASETGDNISLSKTAKMAFERECVAAARSLDPRYRSVEKPSSVAAARTPDPTHPTVENPSSRWRSASRWVHGLAGGASG